MAKAKQTTPKTSRKKEDTDDSFQRHWDETEKKHWNDLDPLSDLTPAQREKFLENMRREYAEGETRFLKPIDTNSLEHISSSTRKR